MQGKTVKETAIIISHFVTPQDANYYGNVHGGVIMRLIDEAGGVVAARHSHANTVTASVDRIDFHNPGFIGEILTFKASLNFVGKTSMEVGVRVDTENIMTGEKRHIASAYLTYVALDNNRKPVEVPPVVPETAEEKRRFEQALSRREVRLAEKKREHGS
jgi:uncharacterized protein (TIGR00369 family)